MFLHNYHYDTRQEMTNDANDECNRCNSSFFLMKQHNVESFIICEEMNEKCFNYIIAVLIRMISDMIIMEDTTFPFLSQIMFIYSIRSYHSSVPRRVQAIRQGQEWDDISG